MFLRLSGQRQTLLPQIPSWDLSHIYFSNDLNNPGIYSRGNKNTLEEIAKLFHISPVLQWSWNLLWSIDDTTNSFLGKNLYLGSMGIVKPTLTFKSKINIYFLRFKVVMEPTLFIYKTIEGIMMSLKLIYF